MSPTSGGSGTDAGNAVTVSALSPTGQALAGARVEIWPADSNATWNAATPSFLATTGTDGQAHLRVPSGSWSVVVRKDGNAYWRLLDSSNRVSDTLRPTARLAGIWHGAEGQILSALGMGSQTRCGPGGFFQFDSLPWGDLSLRLTGLAILRTLVTVDPGTQSMVLVKSDSVPAKLESLPADSLLPWAPKPVPAALPSSALGDTGAFSMAVRLQRTDTTQPVWAISWTDGDSSGVRVGWQGSDTVNLEVNGRPHRIRGIPLTQNSQQVGLSWNGRLIIVYLGSDTLLTLTSTAPVNRHTWKAPLLASQGVSKVEWIAFKRGLFTGDWLVRLSRL